MSKEIFNFPPLLEQILVEGDNFPQKLVDYGHPNFPTFLTRYNYKTSGELCGKLLATEFPTQESPFARMYDEFAAINSAKQGFQVKPNELYHGTSIAALNKILEQGMMRTLADLHHSGELIWGEARRNMDKERDHSTKGVKYLHPDMFEKMNVELTEKDRRIYGHAWSIFFAHPTQIQRTLAYSPKEDQHPDEEKAIIGINRVALTDQGYQFVDLGEEGVSHNGNIYLTVGLSTIIVPDARVEEFKRKTESKYLVRVHSISEFEDSIKPKKEI